MTKIYTATESKIGFNAGTAGATVVGFHPQGTIAGSGHMSHPRDFGDAARFSMMKWRASTVLDNSAIDASGTVEVYFATFDEVSVGTPVRQDGNVGSGDKVLSDPNVKKALHWIGSIEITDLASGAPLSSSGLVWLPARYGSVVFWNNSGQDLSAASGDHHFELFPFGDDIQN